MAGPQDRQRRGTFWESREKRAGEGSAGFEGGLQAPAGEEGRERIS